MAFRVDAYDSFLQVFGNAPFRVLSRKAVEGAQKKKRSNSGEVDPDDTPEVPLSSPVASGNDCETGLQKVALVSLRPGKTFRIVVEHTQDTEPGTVSSTTLTARTTENCKVLSPRSVITDEHLNLLTEDEMINVLVRHPSDWMNCLIEWKQKRRAQWLLSRLYYEGLFTISSPRYDFLLSIPNGDPRYGIDFTKCDPQCWTHSKKVRRLLQGVRRSTINGVQLTCHDNEEDTPQTPQEAQVTCQVNEEDTPQEVQSALNDVAVKAHKPNKAKQVVQETSACPYRVVVNRNFEDTMQHALRYHTAKGGTWMTDSLIKAMSLMSCVGSAHGVRLCAVELWDAESQELLAGCLGFALGAVYHDFTMFTTVRSQASYGSLITKVLASALHDCGYRLWYWGFRVEYMSAFEGRYGACNWPRDEFYELWKLHRSELPVWHVMEYLNEGRGLLKNL